MLSGSCSEEDTVIRSEVADLSKALSFHHPSSGALTQLEWCSCGKDTVKGKRLLAECDRGRQYSLGYLCLLAYLAVWDEPGAFPAWNPSL